MSNLEHYFENLLFMGKDVNGDWNKNSLTEEEQNAVEMCAQYVLYTLFCGRDELKNYLANVGTERHGHWIDTGSGQECSVCGEIQYGYDSGRHYCPNCGVKMSGE